MRTILNAALALAAVVLSSQRLLGEDFTASGTWSAGARNGTWDATLSSDAETVHGTLRMTGASVSTAQVAGTVRSGQVEFGVISGQKEIATFVGNIALDLLGGELTMGGVKGRWSGTWAAVPQPEAPIVDARPGTLLAPFNEPSQMIREPKGGNPCDLLTSAGASVLSGGGLRALQAGCQQARTAGAASLASPATISCNPGPPESNPPTPSVIKGDLVNNISRPQQTWPRITQNETCAIVSATDQQKQVIAYNDTQFVDQGLGLGSIGFGYRSASGAWTQNPGQLALPSSGVAGGFVPFSDPSGVADRNGYFWIAAVGKGLVCVPGACLLYFNIGISKSSNLEGSAFDPATTAIPAGSLFHDKEWLAIDWTSGAGHDTQYLCWTDVDLSSGSSQIMFAHRAPTDQNFSPGVAVSGVRTVPEEVQGCQVAVAPDSSVHVLWWEEINFGGTLISSILGRRSMDGASFGATFNATPDTFRKAADATATADCGTAALRGHIRVAPLPSFAVNHQTGALYITFMRRSGSGSGEIAFVRSTDQGASWSPQLVVNDSAIGDKFMPAVAHSVTQGAIKVFWYDRRNDTSNLSIDVYGATSSNGGGTFGRNVRLTAGLFGVPHLWPENFDCVDDQSKNHPCYMGDYNSLANLDPAAGGFVHAWGDNSLKFHDPDDNLDVPDPDVRTYAGC